MKAIISRTIVIWPLIVLHGVLGAAAAPETCDPASIQVCLNRFKLRFAECGEDDTYCKCSAVLRYGGSCYAACPQEAMTTFIKTVEDGMCATFDPHMNARSADETEEPFHRGDSGEGSYVSSDSTSSSHSGVNASLMKSWLGIDILEDQVNKKTGRLAVVHGNNDNKDINHGSFQEEEKSAEKDFGPTLETREVENLKKQQKAATIKANSTSNTADSSGPTTLSEPTSSPSHWAKSKRETEIPRLNALTVTAADPTTTASLSPQEYQSRLMRERERQNLRSIRSERARKSAEEAARQSSAAARINAATTAFIESVEKDVAAHTSSARDASETNSTHEEKAHRDQASQGSFLHVSLLLSCLASCTLYLVCS